MIKSVKLIDSLCSEITAAKVSSDIILQLAIGFYSCKVFLTDYNPTAKEAAEL